MTTVFSQEEIDRFEKQRNAFLMVKPSDELHEIYIQSTIIETLGLRAGKITEKQDETYSKFIDLLQAFLKSHTLPRFNKLVSATNEQLGRELVLPGMFENYVPDIRQLDQIAYQLQYLFDLMTNNTVEALYSIVKKHQPEQASNLDNKRLVSLVNQYLSDPTQISNLENLIQYLAGSGSDLSNKIDEVLKLHIEN